MYFLHSFLMIPASNNIKQYFIEIYPYKYIDIVLLTLEPHILKISTHDSSKLNLKFYIGEDEVRMNQLKCQTDLLNLKAFNA